MRVSSSLRLGFPLLPLFLGSTSVLAAPFSNGSACASASSYLSSVISHSPEVTPFVPAKLAYDCLQSVPLHVNAARDLVDALPPYVEWQTTTSYLKNPPEGYQEPPVDIYGGLDSISSRIAAGGFSGEYDFANAIYTLFNAAHDGHFLYIPDIIGSVFRFRRSVALVSISDDGTSLPKIYVHADVLKSLNTTLKPSAVSKIGGVDAVTYLEGLAQAIPLQDPNAAYNNLFYELAQNVLPPAATSGPGFFTGGGSGAYTYPGPETTLTFENGTTSSYPNIAQVRSSLTGVTSGEAFYQKFCNKSSPLVGSSSSGSSSTEASPNVSSSDGSPIEGYPAPVISHPDNYIAGYYLPNSDVAVLSIPSFVGIPVPGATKQFQDVAQQFLAKSKAAGKRKLIIDVSANGGGTILLSFDLFKQLFPHLEPYGATRFRAHSAFNIIGAQASKLAAGYPANKSLEQIAGNNPFNYREDLTSTLHAFPSWRAVYGPHTFNADNFTSLIRYNLSDPLQTLATPSGPGIIISGYGNRTNLLLQPYAAEDIVLLTDGYCASTCTLFTEFMHHQAGVKTVVVGGRPRRGPMHAVGGTKGGDDYAFQSVLALKQAVYQSGSTAQQAEWNKTALGKITSLPAQRSYAASMNVRDQIRKRDEAQIPLQFVYEKADYRIWFTPAMVADVRPIWRKVAGVAWGGEEGVC